jgi:hypothetical protein
MAKVDTINTRFGEVEVNYSSLTKNFFVQKYPEKLAGISGLSLRKTRDNGFKTFKELDSYIKEVVHNGMIDFAFKRKIILYKLITEQGYGGERLEFTYMIANESEKIQSHMGVPCNSSEYYILESNHERYVGVRNIFGQITHEDIEKWVVLDYDEYTHEFIKNFLVSFHKLRTSLSEFFDKETVVNNILQGDVQKLLKG